MNKKIKLFANCIPVKGINRSVICDLQKGEVKVIPNDLYDILEKYESHTVDEIKKEYENKYDKVIDEYIDFLLLDEFIFFTTTPHLFPKMNKQWSEPSLITNSILDIDKYSGYDYLSFIDQLDDLNCKHLEIRFFSGSKIILKDILNTLKKKKSIIHSVDVILNAKFVNINFLNELFDKYPRLISAVLYNSDKNSLIHPTPNSKKRIVTTKENLNSSLHCGAISTLYFAVNIKNFTESLTFNSCLNKKISLDTQGNIKNCPSMRENFGNIKDTALGKVVASQEFKKYWNLNKDQINICKDCEFRYICTDCRAYIENPDDIYSKPLKCGYNPYTSEWEKWSTNPLKYKAIEFYGMQELVKQHG